MKHRLKNLMHVLHRPVEPAGGSCRLKSEHQTPAHHGFSFGQLSAHCRPSIFILNLYMLEGIFYSSVTRKLITLIKQRDPFFVRIIVVLH